MFSAEIPNKQIKENRRKWEGGVLKNIMSTFPEQKPYLRLPRSERGSEGAFQIKKKPEKKMFKKKDRKKLEPKICFG